VFVSHRFPFQVSETAICLTGDFASIRPE
jgi:hypothetical protein